MGIVAALLCALIPGTFAQAMNTDPGGQHLQTHKQSTIYPRTAALVDGIDARHSGPFVPSLSSLKNDNPVAHISDPTHCSLGAMDAPAIVAIIGDSNAASSFPGLYVLDLTDGICGPHTCEAVVGDFFSPDRVVIGAESELSRRALLALYEPMASANVPILVTKRRTAELIKYASNAFLATKIMFINELADLCEKVGTDIEELAIGVGLDKRIGSAFLKAGPGYGGSCFPKDTLALLRTAQDHGVALRIVEETVAANAARKRRMGLKVLEALGGEGNGKTVAVLGLTFKAGTDDMREAPSIQLIETLQRFGIHIRAYDPVGIPNAAGMLRDVVFCEDPYACVQDADATVVVTDWESISELSLERMRHLMRSPILVDLRNAFLHSDAAAAGFQVTSIGHSIPAPAEPERHSVVTLVQPVHRSRSEDVRQAGTAGR